MSLSRLANRVKNRIGTGLAATLLYVGSVGFSPTANAQHSDYSGLKDLENQRTNLKSYNSGITEADLPVPLPSPLTQQSEDFYKNPLKEFGAYRDVYFALAKDGVIDGKDISKLEYVLSKTLGEVHSKVESKDKSFLDEMVNSVEGRYYVDFVKEMDLEHLNTFQNHLELKRRWDQNKAPNKEFIHYGSGVCFYAPENQNGEKDRIEGLINRSMLYANPTSDLFGTKSSVRVLEPEEDNPAKTKINYKLGLTLGFMLPSLLGILGYKRKVRAGERKKWDANDSPMPWECGAPLLYSGFLGWAVLDSIHPVFYPVRLGFPLLYEGIQQFRYRNKVASASATSVKNTSPSPTDKRKTEASPELPAPPADFINPWTINIDGKEGGN